MGVSDLGCYGAEIDDVGRFIDFMPTFLEVSGAVERDDLGWKREF